MKRKQAPTADSDNNLEHIAKRSRKSKEKGTTDLSLRKTFQDDVFEISGINSLTRYLDTLDQQGIMKLVQTLSLRDYSLFQKINELRESVYDDDADRCTELDLSQVEKDLERNLDDSDLFSDAVERWRMRAQSMMIDDQDQRNCNRIIDRISSFTAENYSKISQLYSDNHEKCLTLVRQLAEDWIDVVLQKQQRGQMKTPEGFTSTGEVLERVLKLDQVFNDSHQSIRNSFFSDIVTKLCQ